MDLIQQFRNAVAIIKQIRRDEWEFKGHYEYSFKREFTCYTAERNGVKLWVANGWYGCHIQNEPWQLGIFGVLVWYCAARKKARGLEKKMHRRPSDLTS